MEGFIRVRAYKRGRLLWEKEAHNLVVNNGNLLASKLLGGDTSGNTISVIGFGSGTGTPSLTDFNLTGPAYFKAVTSHSYPTNGQVQFNWSLGSGDTGCSGINIQEVALFANTGAIGLPTTKTSGGADPNITMFSRALLGLGTFNTSLTFSAAYIVTA